MLMPDANIAVAHGQMTERDLEETMLSFINGEFDILVTTTIIETGVDVPNANTLIIEEADRFWIKPIVSIARSCRTLKSNWLCILLTFCE